MWQCPGKRCGAAPRTRHSLAHTLWMSAPTAKGHDIAQPAMRPRPSRQSLYPASIGQFNAGDLGGANPAPILMSPPLGPHGLLSNGCKSRGVMSCAETPGTRVACRPHRACRKPRRAWSTTFGDSSEPTFFDGRTRLPPSVAVLCMIRTYRTAAGLEYVIDLAVEGRVSRFLLPHKCEQLSEPDRSHFGSRIRQARLGGFLIGGTERHKRPRQALRGDKCRGLMRALSRRRWGDAWCLLLLGCRGVGG